MRKKRGIVAVVLVLFLVILMSFSVTASGWLGHCAGDQCVSIVVGTEGGEEPLPLSCNGDEDRPTECQAFDVHTPQGDQQIMYTGSEECTFGPTNGAIEPQINGCWFVTGDYDDIGSDECGIARIKPGDKFGNGHGPENILSVNYLGEGAPEEDTDNLLAVIYAEEAWEYICNDDGLWAKCVSDENEGNKVVANGATYECIYNENTGAWIWSTDQDGDGYTTSEDCDDDASDDFESGLGIECPVLTAEETVGKTVSEIRATARGYCEANPGRLSHCAICVNNGAAEVCGDGINNDCGGPGQGEELDESVGVTPDSCNLNQASCKQEFVGHCSESNAVCSDSNPCEGENEQCNLPTNAQEATGVCHFITLEEGQEIPAKEGQPCTQTSNGGNTCGDAEAWLCDQPSINALNIYNAEFDWIETAEGGYCCGFNGAADAGEIRSELDSQQSHVCLTDNKDIVSTEKDFDGNGIEEIFSNSGCENKDWCWVDAASANNLFKVFTIKKPGEMPFDVVSNADDWLMCDAQAEKIFEPPALGEDQEKIKSNRFYCYQEGNRWSWAECAGDWDKRENPSVKGRYTGEGLYTLPLSVLLPQEEPPEDPTTDNDYLREDKIGNTIAIKYDNLYKKYYGKGFLDFTGYDYLNFMVRFVRDEEGNPAELKDLALPLKINLKLVGPKVDGDEVVYFDGNVLGDVINTPLSDMESYMHVQVPIKDYKAIQGFTISTNGNNLIQVRNIYLTSDDQDLQNQLCSGQDALNFNTWLENADAGNPDVGITGQDLCTRLYGDQAWLGEDQEVDENIPGANCCGNAKNEYYSGLSTEFVPDDPLGEAAYYGCWNSEPIASGDTVMDVEFQVQSEETEFNVDYEPVELPIITLHYRAYSQKSVPDPNDDVLEEGTLNCNEGDVFSNTLEVGDTSTALCHFTISEDLTSPLPLEFRGITKLWFEDPILDDPHSPIELLFYDRATNTYFDSQSNVVESNSVRTDEDDEDFEVSGPAQYLSKEEVLDLWNHPISVVARLRPNHFFPISNPAPSNKTVTQNVTYACSDTECLFPLPGNAPYKVTNLHPDLYELYYVTGTLAADETPVTGQQFPEYANLRVKRIAQQVLFYSEGEDSTRDIGFYGCRAADFMDNLEEEKNMQYCAVIEDKFCSYSEVHKEDKNKDEFTVVNTWSDEGLTKVGYNTEGLPQPEGNNISAYYEQFELTLKDQIKSASSRNHSASVLPARNFIPNAEFTTSATKIPYWEVLLNNQVVADEKSSYVIDNKVVLENNEKLRSERISVPSNVDLRFNTAQECIAKISLVDKDGNSELAALTQFNTGEASYVIVEFTGPCEVEQPLLQLVDELGPAEYSYQSHADLTYPDARSGAACCPDNYCWNGYACVEPMGSLTTVTEHISDGRDYRCVDGEWKRAALKFDWNAQQWGFCPQENQCFVLGSGHAENTAQSFYQGDYPICINSSEYIFDNYCNQGNWTSRTKFLATKLLEVAENDEYVLFCSPYQEALLEVGQENYLGGEFSAVQQSTPSLSQSLEHPAQPQILSTCFDTIKDPQGKRLVPDKQNTCINNVCVLQYKDGGEFKVAFATTLNKEIDDPQSFLISLNIPQEQVGEICQQGGNDFIECDLSGLEFPDSANLYYADDLNAVLYARDGIQLSPGIIDTILNWFNNLFGSGPIAEKAFVDEAQQFRNLYIADVDGKQVRAMEEIFPGVKQTLVAEYENFDTPVCDYVKNIDVPEELQLELLEEASGVEKVHCAVNETVQKVIINAGLDFFWPQLTGKLRIGQN